MKHILFLILAIGASVFSYTWELSAQCADTQFISLSCSTTECSETGQKCGDPEVGNVLYKKCTIRTGGYCSGLDLDCDCVAQPTLTCLQKTSCEPPSLTGACTDYTPSGCGGISDANYTTCGGSGCQPG